MMIAEKRGSSMGDLGTRTMVLLNSHQAASKHDGIRGALARVDALPEGPAGTLKIVKEECVRRLLAEIQLASHSPNLRGDTLPGLMDKLRGKIDDLEAIIAASPLESRPAEAENAMKCLGLIARHLPDTSGAAGLKTHATEILRQAADRLEEVLASSSGGKPAVTARECLGLIAKYGAEELKGHVAEILSHAEMAY